MKKTFGIKLAVLVFVMITALILVAACGDDGGGGTPSQGTTGESGTTQDTSGGNEGTTSEPAQEVSKITGMSTYGGNAVSVQQATWFTDILRDEIGVELDFLDTSGADMEQLVMALKAARDLPDIICFAAATDLNNAAEAGLLLNMDDHQDKLPDVYGEHFQHAVAFYRDHRNGGREGLYGMPTGVGRQHHINYNFHLRWDLYQAVGAPTIDSLEAYLPVLKQMMEHYPETADGHRTYGLSIFPEWDGNNMLFAAALSGTYGWDSEYVNPLVEVQVDGSGDPRSILDENSTYMRFVRFFYNANQMGVLDPDSATQTWPTVEDKYKQGRVFLSPWSWAIGGYNVLENIDVENFTGYQPVWADDFRVAIYPDSPTGRDWSMSMSADPTNLDGALRYFNFMYSFNGMDIVMNGPQGVLWDVDASGVRYRTEQGWNILQNDLELPGGGKLGDAFNIINNMTISNDTINPASGQPMSSDKWDDVIGYEPTRLVADWRAKNDGFLDSLARGEALGLTIKSHPATHMVAPVPEDMQITMASIGNIIQTNSWLMVYASSEAEFDQIWRDTVERTNAMGIDEIIEWSTREWAVAKENANKYR